MDDLSIEEIIKRNPRVKRDEFDIVDRLSRQLRETGAKRSGYRIASPDSARVTVRDADKSSRTIQLHSHR